MGHESDSPELSSETLRQALRGAAGEKPSQCAQTPMFHQETLLADA